MVSLRYDDHCSGSKLLCRLKNNYSPRFQLFSAGYHNKDRLLKTQLNGLLQASIQSWFFNWTLTLSKLASRS